MKVSLNWLKELVDVDVTIEELSDLFNLHSAEVEEYYDLVEATNLVVGHVTKKEKHPDADKLSVCQVDIGDKITQIVCGAPNVDQGQNVIVSLPGAVLPGGFKIKQSTIRGVESNGMICSLGELGIDKKYFEDNHGIHVIEENCKPGDNPLEVMFLNDSVMALDLTPNRMDLLSMLGVAYDTAAILNKEVKLKEFNIKESDIEHNLEVSTTTDNCMSYYARVIKDIEIKPSPKWMQSRLIAAGIRPINNVVDITNYVMLETGQPLHAFDYDLVETNKIVVRMAEDGEELVTLDEQTRTLTDEDIVITNGEKIVALGGVMGGFDTEIKDYSKAILLESATFNSYLIRKTSGRLDLRSEASMRFERKVDPGKTLLALEMATDLFMKYASGVTLKGISKFENNDLNDKVIEVSVEKINKVLGTDYSKEFIADILDKIKYKYTVNRNLFTVYAPSRKQDVETYQDLIEEIGRIIGYDNMPTTLPSTVSQGRLSDVQVFKRKINRLLTGLGLHETVTYSLVNKENVYDFTKEETPLVELLMPLSSERNVLTKSPLNGIIDVLKYNIARKNTDIHVFEIGKSYSPDGEKMVLSGALTGEYASTLWQGKKEVVDFYLVKGILQSLFNELGLAHLEFVENKDYKNLHPGQSAYIKDFKGNVGFMGKLHPSYAQKHNLKNVFVFELDLDMMYDLRRQFKKVKEINKFPSIKKDIAVVLDKEVTSKQVIDVIKKAGKRMLNDVTVFDLYVGENVKENEKSLALRLEFSDPKRTLETKEVDERVQAILKDLESKLNATLR